MEITESYRNLIALVILLLVLPESVYREGRSGGATATAEDPTDCDVLGCGGSYACYGNGWPNYLPHRPGERYNIPLNAFHVGSSLQQGQPECLLGSANNYLPWVTQDGRLTVRPGRHALDMSNLLLNDRGFISLVQSVSALVPLEVSIRWERIP